MVKGLKDYKQQQAEEDRRREEAKKPKVQRFNLKSDGDSAVIRFAQEIDFDAKNYNEDRGIGFVEQEHDSRALDSRNGWKNKAKCSFEEEGDCYPCERVRDSSVEWADRKGWKAKNTFYINVIGGEPREEEVDGNTRYFATDVDRKTGEGVVYVLAQSTANGIYEALGDYFLEEEVSGGTITDKFFKVTRKGNEWNDTKYNLTPLGAVPKGAKDLSEFELYDVEEDVIKTVPVAQQKAFYYRGIEAAEPEPVAASATGSDDSW